MQHLLDKLDELIAAIKSVTAKAKANRAAQDNINANLAAASGNYVTVSTYNQLVKAVNNLNTRVTALERK